MNVYLIGVRLEGTYWQNKQIQIYGVCCLFALLFLSSALVDSSQTLFYGTDDAVADVYSLDHIS